MNFARGLLNDPWILFLDEPTLGPGRLGGPRRPRADHGVAGRRARSDGPAHHPLHGRGRRDVRAHRHRRSRPGPGHRHPGRAQAARPERIHLPARARPARRRPGRLARLPGRRQRRRGDRHRADGPGADPRQTVAVNLALAEDGRARRRRRRARRTGSRIVALRKSEPSLEDVFVELVGRGFDEEADGDRRARAAGRPAPRRPARRRRRPARGRAPHETASPSPRRSRRERVRPPPHGDAAGGGRLGPAARSCTNMRGIVGRAYPRVSGILREPSWLFFEIALPFLTTSGFVFVYRALQAPPRVHRLRRPRRRHDGVLAERHLDDGRPALLGEGPGQPRALLHGAGEHDEHPPRDGRRRPDHERRPGRPSCSSSARSSTASSSRSTSGACCCSFLADPGRPVRPRHGAGQPVPACGAARRGT